MAKSLPHRVCTVFPGTAYSYRALILPLVVHNLHGQHLEAASSSEKGGTSCCHSGLHRQLERRVERINPQRYRANPLLWRERVPWRHLRDCCQLRFRFGLVDMGGINHANPTTLQMARDSRSNDFFRLERICHLLSEAAKQRAHGLPPHH
jgi:hypothetical protein